MVAYVPGKPIEEVQKEYGLKDVAKLASNENPLGVSPKALAAMREEAAKIGLYPEGSSAALREKLALHLGVEEDMLMVTNGADHLLSMIAQAFINQGDECIIPDPSFSSYATNTTIMGGIGVKVGLDDFTLDLQAMAEKISPKTKLIFLCNPNNPTATIVGGRAFEEFLSKLPEHVILVMDEAYAEFVEDADYPRSIELVKSGRNIIVARTFSKVYGLAGARVGYGVAPKHLIALLRKVALPFGVNRMGQAGALAALEDEEFVARTLENNKQGRAYLCREFDAMGLSYVPSHANFIFVNIGMDSKTAFEKMLAMGVVVRPGYLWGHPEYLRVSLGTQAENERFIAALKKVIEKL